MESYVPPLKRRLVYRDPPATCQLPLNFMVRQQIGLYIVSYCYDLPDEVSNCIYFV